MQLVEVNKMNRKDFSLIVWNKGVKPFLIITLVYYCINFIYNIFNKDGSERFFTFLIIGISLFYVSISILNSTLTLLASKITYALPESLKKWIRIIINIIVYITPFITGVIIYYSWLKDKTGTIIMVSVILFQRIIEIIKEDKKLHLQQ